MFSKKDLQKLIIPLIIEQILAVTVGMADIMMISSAGDAAVSGISLVDSINLLLINIFSALATGGAVVSSQLLGQKKQKDACEAANQLLISTTLMAILLLLFSIIFNYRLLKLIFGVVEPAVMSNARIYFYISAFSYPFLAIYNSCAALFRSMGNSKISMYTSLCMNVINISGNAILIFGFHMGVVGVAIPTMISRVTAAIIMLVLIRNEKNIIHINKKFKFKLQPKVIKRILRIGIPNGLESGMFQIGKLMVQSLIASFGTAAIAANAVGTNIAALEILPGSAIGLSMITVIGRCIGARDYEQAKQYTIRLLKLAYKCIGIVCIFGLLLRVPILSFYQLTDQATDIASTLIIYHSITCAIIWPLSFTLPNALRAASDVKFTMVIAILSMWIWRIVFSYILAKTFKLGVLGVWIAMTMDWLFRAICFVIRFVRGKWRKQTSEF